MNLVKVSKTNAPVTTSLVISNLFGKRHDNIIRAIETLDCDADFAALNFEVCFKINELANGKPQKYYEVTKDGAMLLIMGFTGKKATELKVSYIREFNRMADMLNQRKELNKRINEHSISDAKSVANGSYHGKGPAKRKKEKVALKRELLELLTKYQPMLELEFYNE